MHYGKAIRKRLIDVEKDQVWLAKELGITRQAVNFMCSKQHINTAKLHKVCDVLGVSVMSLMVKECEL